jgi:NhaA family Na+:H+ antiporter
MPLPTLREFLRMEAAGGIVLMAATVLALLVANSPLYPLYHRLLHLTGEVRLGPLGLAKPLLLWINDGLMAIFFLLVGLEIKREVIEGELSHPAQIFLPGFAALGGVLLPALIYFAFNRESAFALRGWAIPTATDIAFALGVLALAGSHVPTSLKLFLMTLAIMDDLAAILIIALFYTDQLSLVSLALASGFTLALVLLNRCGVMRPAAYLLLGVMLWVSVLKSGIHATLAGVVVALTIPLRPAQAGQSSPLHHLEHSLHPWVTFFILPAFAFANAGLELGRVSLAAMLAPVPLGIMLGLLVGKTVGVMLFSYLSIATGLARLPAGSTWQSMLGVALLAGVGFTMSLFIDSLAFEEAAETYQSTDRLAILLGSVCAALLGLLVLRIGSRRSP